MKGAYMATGSSGKTYSKDKYGNITVKRPDGSTSTVKSTDSSYKSTVNAMHSDGVKNIGVSSGSTTTTKKPAAPATPTVDKQAAQSGMNNAFSGLDKFITAGSNVGAGLVDPTTGSNLGFNGGYQYAADGGYDKLYNDLVSGNVMNNEQYAAQQAAMEQQQAIMAAQAQAEAALKAQINSSVAGMQANEGKIDQGYEDLARQAFVQAKVGQNSLTENLSINGINGGATESAVLGIENQYQQSLAGIGQDKQNALNQLQTDIAQVKASGNAQLAQTMSDYYMKLADASIAADNENYNRLMNSLNMAMQQSQLTGQFNGNPTMQAQQLAYEQAMQQNAYNDDKANAEYDKQQRAYLNAVNEIQSFGKVISPSLIQALGGQSIADQMAKSYLQQQLGPMTTGSSGGSGSSTQKKSSSGSYSSGTGGAALMATLSPKPQTAPVSSGNNTSNGGFYEMNVGNAQPTAIIDRYKTGQITYQQLEMWLNKFGYSPAQFGIKK
jgi:hypothetical protein